MKNIIYVLILCILTGCSKGVSDNMSTSSYEQIKCAIYPTGTFSESYCFILNTDGELIAEKGIREGDDIIQNPFIKDVEETKKKKLSFSEIEKIKDLADEIYKNDYSFVNQTISDDNWEIQIFYQQKVVRQDYWEGMSEVKKLIDEIINISPVDVDLHGWS